MKSPERALWTAVLERAWEDALGEAVSTDGTPPSEIRMQARDWIERGNGTFRTACQAIGLDVEAVQSRYRIALEDQRDALIEAIQKPSGKSVN